ncbi:1-alkyl-2-acetylglycerophosphocholine esterase [Drechslerella dactyloides]|uniref:1-alkyl-2-acetylglycerophosphocholine esterase n=1 Tax=Drechslerella dactyloides TaxID=74499 RepID=A0AAD6IZH2_DREDA|nr:1-alkyl-2-acetylglycerophosphocholine esterase [Drechslerella dactyloides]
MLCFAFLAGAVLGAAAAVSTKSDGEDSVRYSFPELSGPYCVGKTQPIVLTDDSRKDVFNNDTAADRQVLVRVYYPTAKGSQFCPGEAYATPGFAVWISNFLSGNVSTLYFEKFKTHSVTNAPLKHIENHGRTAPLLLYSHGLGVPAKLNQILVEDVASHGYIVVQIEHPWDSGYTEFPDGRVVGFAPLLAVQPPGYSPITAKAVDVRAADTLFVLDSIKCGKVNVRGCDLASLADRVGMFGHSLGGQLSLVAMLQTNKIIAGSNMDGWFWNGANATNLTDPSAADAHRPYSNLRSDPALLPDFVRHAGGGPENQIAAMKVQTGPKVQLIVTNSSHYSYTDLTQLSIPALNANMREETKAFQAWTGTVEPKRMHMINTEYHNWFFDITMKGKGSQQVIAKPIKNEAAPVQDTVLAQERSLFLATNKTLGASDKPRNIGIVAFPGWQPLDIMGPFDALWILSRTEPINVFLLNEKGGTTTNFLPGNTAPGSKVAAVVNVDHTLAKPPPLDVVLVPGASILGRAGLLDGKQATTNKAAWKFATQFGKDVQWKPSARYVHDGNIWTTSGVSAGTDGVIAWIESVWGAKTANDVANDLEWNRSPADGDKFGKIHNLY